MSVMTITKDNFEQVVTNSAQPVLIDFWASWCGPCRMLGPVVDEVAQDAEGFTVGKVNVDEEPELARQFSVMTIPTLLVFKNGVVAGKNVGLIGKDAVLKLVQGV